MSYAFGRSCRSVSGASTRTAASATVAIAASSQARGPSGRRSRASATCTGVRPPASSGEGRIPPRGYRFLAPRPAGVLNPQMPTDPDSAAVDPPELGQTFGSFRVETLIAASGDRPRLSRARRARRPARSPASRRRAEQRRPARGRSPPGRSVASATRRRAGCEPQRDQRVRCRAEGRRPPARRGRDALVRGGRADRNRRRRRRRRALARGPAGSRQRGHGARCYARPTACAGCSTRYARSRPAESCLSAADGAASTLELADVIGHATPAPSGALRSALASVRERRGEGALGVCARARCRLLSPLGAPRPAPPPIGAARRRMRVCPRCRRGGRSGARA